VPASSISFELSANATATQNPVTLTFFTKIPQMSLKGGSDSLTWNGADLSMTGNIYASGGTIASWTIGSNLTAGTAGSSTYMKLAPTATYPKIQIGAKSGIDVNSDGVHIGSNGISLGAGTPFKVTAAGYLTASSGLIGGWTIGDTLSATNILLDPNGGTGSPKITLAGKTSLTSADTGVWISTDGIALGISSPFSVTAAGYLTASSALIGGWNVDDESMYTGTKKDSVDYTAAVADITIHKDHGILAYQFYLGTDGNAKFKGAIEGGTIQIGSSDAVFSVNTAGMYLGDTTFADAEFSVTPGGDMHAELGDIAGWDFDDKKLTKQHATEPLRIELDTDVTIKDSTDRTGRQAISMTSGSTYLPVVQMSNWDGGFIDEEDTYTADVGSGGDYLALAYASLVTTITFTTFTSANYAEGHATLVGAAAAGGGGESA
jgi:hypothetical protein